MKTRFFLLILLFSIPFIFSCNKKEVKTSPVHFYLMDSPTDYDSVNVHIKRIEAEVFCDSTVWMPLHTRDTVVNLFHLQDSITMLVAQDIVPMGILKQIRFILGNDNTVFVKGISHPLEMANEGSAGMIIDINKKLNEVFNGFILDFDASQSIVEDSGTYRLSPVIRLIH
ncbi:MAG TPA: DUF4382 domain-containing protein [Chitinophagaceae bacterium]|nr:DUF4382 domain-containing protein [Chitinophagaceae bacterium]